MVAVKTDGEIHCSLKSLVRDADVVMLLQFVAQSLQDLNRLIRAGFIDDDLLKAPLQRRICFDITPVLRDGRGPDDSTIRRATGLVSS